MAIEQGDHLHSVYIVREVDDHVFDKFVVGPLDDSEVESLRIEEETMPGELRAFDVLIFQRGAL